MGREGGRGERSQRRKGRIGGRRGERLKGKGRRKRGKAEIRYCNEALATMMQEN